MQGRLAQFLSPPHCTVSACYLKISQTTNFVLDADVCGLFNVLLAVFFTHFSSDCAHTLSTI